MSCSARQWIERYASKLGLDPPTDEQVGVLLELAAAAAHASERTAAPVSTWIAACAAVDLEHALSVAEELAEELAAQAPGPTS
jgi:hypothetical protein